MEGRKTEHNSEFVGKKASLFPELTALPVAPVFTKQEKPPEGLKTEIDPTLYNERFQLSSRFDLVEPAPTPQLQPDPLSEAPEAVPYEPDTEQITSTKPAVFTKKRLLLAGGLLTSFIVLGLGGYILFHPKQEPKVAIKPSSVPTAQLPMYVPKKLPAGYVYNNDLKTDSTNVYSMSVTGPKKEYFYITEQNAPVNFDFTPFNKQLTDPRTYTAAIGTVTTGATKSSFIVSIRTEKDTWVIINSPNTGAQSVIEPIINSLAL